MTSNPVTIPTSTRNIIPTSTLPQPQHQPQGLRWNYNTDIDRSRKSRYNTVNEGITYQKGYNNYIGNTMQTLNAGQVANSLASQFEDKTFPGDVEAIIIHLMRYFSLFKNQLELSDSHKSLFFLNLLKYPANTFIKHCSETTTFAKINKTMLQ